MAAPSFRLHIPAPDEVAVGEDDLENLFPHTPRLDDRNFEEAVSEELVEECLRAGSCAANGAEREWMGTILHRLGHAANDRGDTLMAHSWFQLAYAAKGTMIELLSSTNMRLKLGQWNLCERLYAHAKTLELTDKEMEVAERKHKEVTELLAGRGGSSTLRRPERLGAAEELDALLSSPAANAGVLSAEDVERMLALLRGCGHHANRRQDYAFAHLYFDCAYALSSIPSDLLSAANMRVKLLATSSVAGAIYNHILNSDGQEAHPPGAKLLAMATEKLSCLETSRASMVIAPPAQGGAGGGGGDDPEREYF